MPTPQGFQSVNVQAKAIKGLVPAFERREVQKPFVLDGKNFLVDLKGPYSAFSNRIVTYERIRSPARLKTFRIGSQAFAFTTGAVLAFDTTAQMYYPVFTFDDLGIDWPWFSAQVAGKYYFVKKGTNLLQYDPVTQSWNDITTSVPTNPISCTQSLGRLVVLGDINVGWSSIDDGSDFVPSTVTGAGFQGLSIIDGRQYGIAVAECVDGFYTYTSKGVFKSEQADGANPFRHFPISKQYAPLSPYCIVTTENKDNIILDKKGFFTANGGRFSAYEELMGEYLSHEVISQMDVENIGSQIRLDYNEQKKWFIVSIGSTNSDSIYQKAYVLYTARDEWGSFDYNHYAFGEVSIDSGANKGFNFGFYDTDGYLHRFIDDIFSESAPDRPSLIDWHQAIDIPTRVQNGTYIFASNMHMTAFNEGNFENLPSGLYQISDTSEILEPEFDIDPNYTTGDTTIGPDFLDYMATSEADEDWNLLDAEEDWGIGDGYWRLSSSMQMVSGLIQTSYSPYIPINNGLNSEIEVGLFRYTEQQYPDEFGLVTNVMIGAEELTADNEIINYQAINDIVEDWDAISGTDEDWGFGFTQTVDFTPIIRATNDGYDTFEDQEEELELIESEGHTRQYSCQNNGIYHSIKLTANNADQSFRLRSLELSGMLSGRLR